MNALVVYESMYGNTAEVAEAIGRGLEDGGLETTVMPVDRAATDVDADLVVVGGPTHAHGMSRPSTRAGALKDDKNTFEAPTTGSGLRTWLETLPTVDGRAAAFDTRLDKSPILVGSAAKGIGRGLQHRGRRMVAAPESFFVTTSNELVDGELDRARAWGSALGTLVRAAAPV
jgi:flavodoxin-like protein